MQILESKQQQMGCGGRMDLRFGEVFSLGVSFLGSAGLVWLIK